MSGASTARHSRCAGRLRYLFAWSWLAIAPDACLLPEVEETESSATGPTTEQQATHAAASDAVPADAGAATGDIVVATSTANQAAATGGGGQVGQRDMTHATAGRAGTGGCTPHRSLCQGQMLVTCSADGQSQTEQLCKLGCSADQCLCDTQCGGTCTDLTSDPNNCGGCGHNCPSGTCVASRCAAIRLVEGEPTILRIEVGATDVFYLERDTVATRVMKVPIAGGEPVMLANLNAMKATGELAVAADHIYWSTSTGDIFSAPIAGGTGQLLNPGHEELSPWGLLAHDGFLYFANDKGVHKLSTSTGTDALLLNDSDSFGFGSIVAVESNLLYGLNSRAINTVGVEGGAVTSAISEWIDIVGMTVAAGRLFWSGIPANGAAPVLSTRAALGGAETVVASNVRSRELAVDETHIYYTTPFVHRVSISGGGSEQIGGSGWNLRVDAQNIYWSEDHAILKLPK